ncbi:unnamed protein product [Cuscuta europaea]|uniref:Uncharacterized protein n=1 Tax=Cuscuta europaea TaxID=41803 RepID=A0A9P0YQA5_CUSEU|nr:unnamed protein product [Cuscuta europaea]
MSCRSGVGGEEYCTDESSTHCSELMTASGWEGDGELEERSRVAKYCTSGASPLVVCCVCVETEGLWCLNLDSMGFITINAKNEWDIACRAHPLSTSMVVRQLEVDKDTFRPRGDDEDILCPEVPYLSAIEALMYLASHTRLDISFAVNLLATYSSSPMRRHWNGVKQILHYLQGYLSDPRKGRSQTGYLFTCGGTSVSWRSMKQTIAETSSNHAELLAIHEASRECVYLRTVIRHTR